jgi:hypothetical protein
MLCGVSGIATHLSRAVRDNRIVVAGVGRRPSHQRLVRGYSVASAIDTRPSLPPCLLPAQIVAHFLAALNEGVDVIALDDDLLAELLDE